MKVFEEVLTQYEPMISAIIRKLHIYRDFEQYRQVGRVALWQAWKRFDKNKGNFTPFAYRSIRGAMLDEMKRKNRFEDHVMPTEDEVLTEWVEAKGTWAEPWNESLQLAIEKLSRQEIELLKWLFAERRTQAECACLAGVSVPAIKKRQERILGKMRKMLKTPYEEGRNEDGAMGRLSRIEQ
ncbi:sigma-70 family RNA polymerase sigma factor [Sporosarcina sp. Te-1]|uniref:sigma-70 family RNA polymerase sigma factor n=1 Tax=Sporosarcina sp. Te-1 TaxID=2818390 RepID=UPI001A9DE698|nr:sigma-70 family RNA polymerase sigma factor [Sporosarcina sp. Te-1]QTD40823.1 sigma-70 family RNA polymerase sigma factor [Sporosarcina sp. Te-1]